MEKRSADLDESDLDESDLNELLSKMQNLTVERLSARSVLSED